MQTIISENREYWTRRAPSYSELNAEELQNGRRRRWSNVIGNEISNHFPGREPNDIRVLEVGTGPGFFAILLCSLGYNVTAIDLTPAMLAEAKKNSGDLAGKIRYMEMNAELLDFDDHSFDVVISRNLTWDLPNPDKAYSEWVRVLKDGGLLLNFDANWYAYLFDEKAKASYEMDRINVANAGVTDCMIVQNYEVMEDIARRIPLSRISRPQWDVTHLSGLGMHVETDPNIWEYVWSEEEKINNKSTPMFMVKAHKM